MNKLPTLYLSPINKPILLAAKNFSKDVGYIISQRQWTIDGGYVDKQLMDIVFSSTNKIERDHFCLSQQDDLVAQIEADAKFFDIIHIDPWYKHNFNIKETNNWLSNFIQYDNNIKFEFGTEDFIQTLSVEKYRDALENTKEYHDHFEYLVCQGGSVVFDLQNVSPVDIEKTKQFVNLGKEYGLKIKRHNCDFHTDEDLRLLKGLGIDAFNFAPEFTYLSNKIIIEHLTEPEREIILQEVELNAPWSRWLNNLYNENKVLLSCLHYIEYHPIIKKYLEKYENEIVESVSQRIQNICEIVC
jgi:hypothetical protein